MTTLVDGPLESSEGVLNGLLIVANQFDSHVKFGNYYSHDEVKSDGDV